MDFLYHLVSEINSVLWGVFCLIPLLCGTGIFYSIKLRFVQVRKFGLATRLLFGGATLFGKHDDAGYFGRTSWYCVGYDQIVPSFGYRHRCSSGYR